MRLAGIAGVAVQSLRQAYRRMRRNAARADRNLVERYIDGHEIAKLHIGCGSHALPGWLNSDANPGSPGILQLDAAQPFPIPSGKFDFVFSEHMIEHLSYPDGTKLLSECYRILKDGGKIRISTPDLAFLVELYREEKSDLQTRYLEWAGEQFVASAPARSDTFVINNFVRSWGHRFIYDEKTLRAAMERAGFVGVTRCPLRESESENLRDLENEGRMPDGFLELETFTLEGTKLPNRS